MSFYLQALNEHCQQNKQHLPKWEISVERVTYTATRKVQPTHNHVFESIAKMQRNYSRQEEYKKKGLPPKKTKEVVKTKQVITISLTALGKKESGRFEGITVQRAKKNVSEIFVKKYLSGQYQNEVLV